MLQKPAVSVKSTYFGLSYNCCACCAGDIPEELGALGHLQILFLHTNELTGEGRVKQENIW